MSTYEIPIPSFKKNQNAYRDFILRHKAILDDDSVRNADVLVRRAEENGDLTSFAYGETGNVLEEVVWHVLDGLGVECDFLPATELYISIGVSRPGQVSHMIEIQNEEDLKLPQVKALQNGSLDW